MLLQTVDEIVGVTMEEMEIPTTNEFRMTSFALDFVRGMQKDVKTSIPNRDKEQFYQLDYPGYHVLNLPVDFYDYVSVGVQVGRYIKGLAINNRVTTHKIQPDPSLLIQTSTNNTWYFGGLYGYGMLWGVTGAIDAYGNGNDYGDITIDFENKLLITSPSYRFKNVMLRYYPNCITPSADTCIHPWFILALKNWLNYKYWYFRGDPRWQAAKIEYEKEYLFAVQSKYRMKIPTIVKIFERIRGYHHG